MTLVALAAAGLLTVQAATDPAPRGDPASWFQNDASLVWPHHWSGEAAVRFRAQIGPDGRVNGCWIQVSSGHHEFDRAACRVLFLRARFDPARNAAGAPVAGHWWGRVVYRESAL